MSEQLIYALSSIGQVNFDRFNEIFKKIYVPSNRYDEDLPGMNLKILSMRILESLGYCEIDYNNRKFYMCPPSLVLLPSSALPHALLTGARTPSLLEKIKMAIKKRKEIAAYNRASQKNRIINLPDTVSIETTNTETLKEIAQETGIMYSLYSPAAWNFANYSASIFDVEQSLKFEKCKGINWKKRNFISERLAFSYESGEEKNDEYRFTEYTNPVNQQKMHWLWRGKCVAEVTRDWGRYIFLKITGNNILEYDVKKQVLNIPITVPLPCMLARAVALCSGMAPRIKILNNISLNNTNLNNTKRGIAWNRIVQTYPRVPEVIAGIVGDKLGQKF